MKENLKVEDLKQVLNDKANQAVQQLDEMINNYQSAYHESKEKLEVMQEIETYTSNLEKLEGKVNAYIEIAKEFDIELDIEVVDEQEESEDAIEGIVEPTNLVEEPLTENSQTTTLIEPLPEVQESKEVIYALKTDSVAEEVVEPIHINPKVLNDELDEALGIKHNQREEPIDEIREQVEENASKLVEPITDVLVVAEVQQFSKETLESAIKRILSKNLHKYSEKYNTPFDTISFLIFYNEDKKAIEFNLYILKRFVTKLALPSDILDDDDSISTLDIITELRKKLDAYCVEFNCEKQDVKVQLATTSNTDDTVYLALVIRSSFVRWIDIAECVQQAMFSQKF